MISRKHSFIAGLKRFYIEVGIPSYVVFLAWDYYQKRVISAYTVVGAAISGFIYATVVFIVYYLIGSVVSAGITRSRNRAAPEERGIAGDNTRRACGEKGEGEEPTVFSDRR